jgi:hypothetical protein
MRFVHSPIRLNSQARLQGESRAPGRLRELLRQARERAAKDTGQPYQKPPPLPPTNNGHPWTIDDILVARRDQIRRPEAAQQQ